MTDARLIADIQAYAHETGPQGHHFLTAVRGLSVLCDPSPTPLEAMIYDPVICLVLQGQKETRIGDRCIRFGAGESLIVSHTLPVIAAVTEASRDRPYVAMVLSLDLSIARSLHDEFGKAAGQVARGDSLEAATTDPKLTEAMGRLFRASLDPVEAQALAPLIVREIHFRLLQADHGGMLRQLLLRDSAASRIEKAIARIRADRTRTVPVSELAKTAGMSVSAFHEHFKKLTATSPLQYQKDLRLTEARRLITSGAETVASAAFEVGYESPTQFSREYSRKFGVAPRVDLAAAATP